MSRKKLDDLCGLVDIKSPHKLRQRRTLAILFFMADMWLAWGDLTEREHKAFHRYLKRVAMADALGKKRPSRN